VSLPKSFSAGRKPPVKESCNACRYPREPAFTPHRQSRPEEQADNSGIISLNNLNLKGLGAVCAAETLYGPGFNCKYEAGFP